MGNLRIDAGKCVGCGKCVRMCLVDNIRLVDGKASEIGAGCIRCGHCVSSCPKGAIELAGGEAGSGLRESGFLDGRLVSEEDLQIMYAFMKRGTFGGSELWLKTLQGDELDRYLKDAWTILRENAAELPVVGSLERRSEGRGPELDPSLWEGKQVLFIFSDSPDHAFEASNRMKAAGLGLGIAGFHSNALMMAHKLRPDVLDAYFPDSKGKMYMAYVIGHGRRLVEPIFKPLQGLKGIFRRSAQRDAGFHQHVASRAGDVGDVHLIPGNLQILGQRDEFGAEIDGHAVQSQRNPERNGFSGAALPHAPVKPYGNVLGGLFRDVRDVELDLRYRIGVRGIAEIRLLELYPLLHQEQFAVHAGDFSGQSDVVVEADALEAGSESFGFDQDIILSVWEIESDRLVRRLFYAVPFDLHFQLDAPVHLRLDDYHMVQPQRRGHVRSG